MGPESTRTWPWSRQRGMRNSSPAHCRAMKGGLLFGCGGRGPRHRTVRRVLLRHLPFPDPHSHRILLSSLEDDGIRKRLRLVWSHPARPQPRQAQRQVHPKQLANRLALLAKSLERERHSAEDVGNFLKCCLFNIFAGDVDLITKKFRLGWGSSVPEWDRKNRSEFSSSCTRCQRTNFLPGAGKTRARSGGRRGCGSPPLNRSIALRSFVVGPEEDRRTGKAGPKKKNAQPF